MECKELTIEEINHELFSGFIRRQEVTKCYRKTEGEWHIADVPFIDDWSQADYDELICHLHVTLKNGGIVFGAFENGKLKGFSCLTADFFGDKNEYIDLQSIHVSADMRGKGIGKELFRLSADWAKTRGAKKLYISGHSAVETQAFYKNMGCTEAAWYNMEHVKKEPFDCQLELIL